MTGEKWSKSNLYRTINDLRTHRLSFEEYKAMKKKQLLISFKGFIINYDTIRHQLVEVKLENNYLWRRIALLEDTIKRVEFSGQRHLSRGSRGRKTLYEKSLEKGRVRA